MLLADSNVWLALAISKHPFHPAAGGWFARQNPSERVIFCRSTQQSFMRLLTTRAVMAPYGMPPLTNKAAWSMYERFLADRRSAWADEPRDLEPRWKKLASVGQSSPKLWMDAYLAAFALTGGHHFVTIDKSFKQFKGLDLIVLSQV